MQGERPIIRRDDTVRKTASKECRPAGSRRLRLAALCGLTAPVLVFAVVFIAAAFTPGYSHIANTVSQLGAWHRPHPWIMNTGFIVFGLLIIGLAYGLYRQTNRRYLSSLILSSLTIFGLGIILAGFFHDGPKGMDNLESDLHSDFALAAFFGLVAAIILFAVAVRRNSQWRGYTRASIIIAVAAVLFSSLFMVEALSPIEGLLQRLFCAPSLGWIFAVSWRMHHLGKATRV